MQDRALFLEIILAARKRLILSYQGYDPKTNEQIPAAVPLQELLDYCHKNYSVAVCVEKLHGFSFEYFEKGNREHGDPEKKEKYLPVFPSVSEENFAGAKALKQWLDCPGPVKSFAAELPEVPDFLQPENELFLSKKDLCSFFENPGAGFLKGTLSFSCPGISDDLQEDTEPFSLSKLDEYWLTRQMFHLKKHKDYDPRLLQDFLEKTQNHSLEPDSLREQIECLTKNLEELPENCWDALLGTTKCEGSFSFLNMTVKDTVSYTVSRQEDREQYEVWLPVFSSSFSGKHLLELQINTCLLACTLQKDIWGGLFCFSRTGIPI